MNLNNDDEETLVQPLTTTQRQLLENICKSDISDSLRKHAQEMLDKGTIQT